MISAEVANYLFTGTDATLTYTSVGAFTITADAANYPFTGTAAALTYASTYIPPEAEVPHGGAAKQIRYRALEAQIRREDDEIIEVVRVFLEEVNQ